MYVAYGRSGMGQASQKQIVQKSEEEIKQGAQDWKQETVADWAEEKDHSDIQGVCRTNRYNASYKRLALLN